MKNTLLIIFSLLFITLTASKCKKDKPNTPLDQLPPETQIGANTFGCLVNGKVFLPKGSLFGSPSLKCAYQYLDNGSSKGFYFQLSATHKYSRESIETIGIYTENLEIKKGSFNLEESFQNEKASGYYSKFTDSARIREYTKDNLPGKLTITKFDEINQIVSGTFGFSVVVNPGDTIKITDGRFDMQFTK